MVNLKYIFEFIDAYAAQFPNLTAIIADDIIYTYSDLNNRINQISHVLIANNLIQEDIVGVMLDRSFDLIAACIAIFKAGGTFLPIDFHYPLNRIQFIIDDSKPKLILTHSHQLEKINLPSTLETSYILLDKLSKKTPTLFSPVYLISENNLAYLIYTSGTTGSPKGVLVEHKGLINLSQFQKQFFDLTPLDRVFQFSSCAFDAFIWEICGALCAGSSIYLTAKENIIPGEALINSLIKSECTMITLTPSALYYVQDLDLPKLRILVSAGEACPASFVEKFSQYQFYNAYGPTETTVCATIYRADSSKINNPWIPIGEAISGTYVRVMQGDQPISVGGLGELCIGGLGVARGYLNQPRLTHEFFIDDPLSPGHKLYKTGDLVSVNEFNLIEYKGRKDSQIKIYGYRIEPGEVERALENHPSVLKAVVDKNPNIEKLCAFVCLDKKSTQCTAAKLRVYLKRQLPAYMIPHSFYFFDTLPLTTNGKIDFTKIKNVVPKKQIPTNLAIPIEKTLINIFSEKLQHHLLDEGEDFFDSGLESIVLADLVYKINYQLNTTITITDIFESPTIRLLSEKIKNKSKAKKIKIDFIQELENHSKSIETLRYDYEHHSPKSILITGATGFLGTFTLYNLLNNTDSVIYCLVRANNTSQAIEKLINQFKYYQLDTSCLNARVKILLGHLGDASLGLDHTSYDLLAREVDIIYHIGGDTSFIKPYNSLLKSNVLSLIELLRFSQTYKAKKVEYVSTLAVFSCRHHFENILEYDEFSSTLESAQYLNYDSGYVQTKWLGDSLAQHAIKLGYPLTIHRPGYILCDGRTGITSPDQKWSLIARGCFDILGFPELIDQCENFVMVDDLSGAIVRLSLESSSIRQIFHYSPEETNLISTIDFFEMIRTLGFPKLEKLNYSMWVNRIIQSEDNATVPLLPLLAKKVYKEKTLPELYQHTPRFKNEATSLLLRQYNIDFNLMNSGLLKKYINAGQQHHLFPLPEEELLTY